MSEMTTVGRRDWMDERSGNGVCGWGEGLSIVPSTAVETVLRVFVSSTPTLSPLPFLDEFLPHQENCRKGAY